MRTRLQRRYPRVHFAGIMTAAELARYYRAADVFVFSRPDRHLRAGDARIAGLRHAGRRIPGARAGGRHRRKRCRPIARESRGRVYPGTGYPPQEGTALRRAIFLGKIHRPVRPEPDPRNGCLTKFIGESGGACRGKPNHLCDKPSLTRFLMLLAVAAWKLNPSDNFFGMNSQTFSSDLI